MWLDGCVVGTINLIVSPFVGLDYMSIGNGNFPDRIAYVIATLFAFLVGTVYFVWFWSGGRRATPGQRVFRIQVATAFDGRPLTSGQALRRYLGLGQWVAVLLVLPYISAAIFAVVAMTLWYLVLLISTLVSPTKQGIHDWFAGSAVVRPARAGTGWAAGCLGLVLLLGVPYAAFTVWSFTLTSEYMLENPGIQVLRDYIRWLWPS